ncbi:MAG: CheR family methyltransferase [Myxococcaceae bacterium]
MSAELERFRSALTAHLGLAFDESKETWLGEVLARRLAETRQQAEAYLEVLEHMPSQSELRWLAQKLTVGETYFFRQREQFNALADVLEPQHQVNGVKVARLLSAGCASGEEAYTLAIVARESLQARGWSASIRAFDLNPESLAKAAKGVYSSWSLRETSQPVRERWFRPQGQQVVLADELRAAVRFEERNLISDDPSAWADGAYDAIFFRNVLMYFSPEVASAVVAKMARCLAPGGHLFLGHAETLRGLSTDFHLRHTHDTFYYQRKPGPPRVRPLDIAAVAAERTPTAGKADSWFDSIQRASERVAALTEPAADSKSAQGWNVAEARRLIERERFDQGLELLRALPPESRSDPEVLLLWAVALFQRGQLVAAEETCRALLAKDELNAGAHYVLALCRDGARDLSGAAEEDRFASYLDPGFAMPRMHLGMLARRGGDLFAAHKELHQALWLLEREDPSRLLLFSGGFGRQALISVCQQELDRLGAAR